MHVVEFDCRAASNSLLSAEAAAVIKDNGPNTMARSMLDDAKDGDVVDW